MGKRGQLAVRGFGERGGRRGGWGGGILGKGGVEVVAYPLYSFLYTVSAPAVYSSRLLEQVMLSFDWTWELHQSWKMVLLVMASVRVELG